MQTAKFVDLDENLIRKEIDVNCVSNIMIVKDFLPEMIKKDSGQIVTISSMAGLAAFPYLTSYSASKYASVGAFEGLRSEMAS